MKKLSNMAKQIYDYVLKNGHVSFVELSKHIPGFYNPDDSTMYTFAKYPNIVIWMNVSDEAVQAMEELVKSNRVFLNPCSSMVYLADGKILLLPIPKRVPPVNEKLWWVPCVLHTQKLKNVKSFI
jgi:hypothetical protein